MTMEYRTVTTEHSDILDECVNELIAQGWRPIGGASVSARFRDPEYLFVQAMVRPKPKLAVGGQE